MTNDCAETHFFFKSLYITIPEPVIDNKLSALSTHRNCQATGGDNCPFDATDWMDDRKGLLITDEVPSVPAGLIISGAVSTLSTTVVSGTESTIVSTVSLYLIENNV